jgi:hypothetical protein
MDINFRYTQHQVARGTRPDAETYGKLYLIKNVSELRATYQVRLLAYRAQQEGSKLIICLPKGAKQHSSLRKLRRDCGTLIKIERT